jgi:four helix bundle protein
MAKRFEDLAAWRFCTELCQRVEELTGNVGHGKFRDQIREAAASAPALIAEGFARFTTGEMIRYLRMARGELAEVQNHIKVVFAISTSQPATPNPWPRWLVARWARPRISSKPSFGRLTKRCAARSTGADPVRNREPATPDHEWL